MDRNTPIDAQRIRSLRKELHWTQEELARRAKLSVRVVAKAEAGQAVALRTVQTLVDTFQMAGKDISLADLQCNLEALVRQFLKNYATYQAECVEHSRAFISPNIVALVDGDPDTNPIAGTYRGIDEFAKFFRKFFAIFVRDGGTLADDPEIRRVGNEVFAWGHEAIRIPQANPQPAGFVMLRVRFDGGLMTYFEDRYESSGMMMQLDQWARAYPEADWLKHVNHQALLTGEYRKPYQPPRE